MSTEAGTGDGAEATTTPPEDPSSLPGSTVPQSADGALPQSSADSGELPTSAAAAGEGEHTDINGTVPSSSAAAPEVAASNSSATKPSPPAPPGGSSGGGGRILHGFSVAAPAAAPVRGDASEKKKEATSPARLVNLPRETSLPSSASPSKDRTRAGGMRVILPPGQIREGEDENAADLDLDLDLDAAADVGGMEMDVDAEDDAALPARQQNALPPMVEMETTAHRIVTLTLPAAATASAAPHSALYAEEGSPASGDGDSGELQIPTSIKPTAPPPPGTPLGKVVEAGREHTGRWTKEEHDAFLNALQTYGKEWKKVAAKVKTRTVVQTRTHAQKYFQKLQKVMKNTDDGKGGGGLGAGVGGLDPAVALAAVEMGTAEEAKTRQQQQQQQQATVPAVGGGGGGNGSMKKSGGGTRQSRIPPADVMVVGGGPLPPPPSNLNHHQEASQGAAAEAAAHLMAQMSSGRSPPPPPQVSQTHGFQQGPPPPAAPSHRSVMSMKIVAPAHDAATKRGKFPEPSPAACGKRKLAEIAAAQMLAGVASSRGVGGGVGGRADRTVPAVPAGHATPPLDGADGTTQQGANAVTSSSAAATPALQRPGGGFSLQILNPDALGVSFDDSADGGGKRKRLIHGQPSPSTPWDGQLEALVSEVKSKDTGKGEKANSEDVSGMPDMPFLDADDTNVDEDVWDSSLPPHPLRGPSSRSDLHKAICEGSLQKVSGILETEGAAVKRGKDDTGSSIKIVSELDKVGFFPLHSAAAVGMMEPTPTAFKEAAEIAQLLLTAGADASCCDANGNTPLHWAARAGNGDVAQVLIMKSCPLDAQNEGGETALHWALRAGTQGLSTTHALLQNGARASIFNREFKRPLDVASRGFDNIGQGKSSGESMSLLLGNINKMAEMGKVEERRQVRTNLLMHSPQSRTLVLHHPECLDHVPKSSFDWEAPDRVQSIMARILRDETQPDNSAYLHPHEVTVSTDFDRAPLELLSRVHSAEYLAFVNDLSKELERRRKKHVVEENEATSAAGGAERKTGGDPHVVPFTPMVQRTMMRESESAVKKGAHSDTSFSAGSLRAARRAAGAVQHAVDRVLVGRNRNAFCVVRPPGHHAGVNGLLSGGESCGFCIFNSVAAGAMHALSDESHRPRCERCAIVDIDAHHGNGTEEIVRKCHDPGRLLFFSVHLFDHDRRKGKGPGGASSAGYKFYPGTGEEDDVAHNIINVPIAPLWREKEVLQSTSTNFDSSAGSANSVPPVNRHNTRQKSKRAAAVASRSTSPARSLPKNSSDAAAEKAASLPKDASFSDTDASSADGNSSRATSSRAGRQRSPTPQPAHYLMGVGRQAYRRAIQQRLLPALRAFNPDLILISSGFDASRGDVGNARHYVGGKERMGLDLEPEDYAWSTRKIMEIADICCHGRVVSVLEGGYGRTPTAPAQPQGSQGGAPLTNDTHHLDKTVFTECAVRHLQALVDPFDDEMRHVVSDTAK